MLRMFKNMKPFLWMVITTIFLILVAVICDLMLPDRMSSVVNTGITQGGVERTTPNVIRQGELDKLLPILSDDEKASVLSHFTLMEKNVTDAKVFDKNVKRYPLLETEPLYVLNTPVDKAELSELNDTFALLFLLKQGVETDPEAVLSQQPSDGEAMKARLAGMTDEELAAFMGQSPKAALEASLQRDPSASLEAMAAQNPAMLETLMGPMWEQVKDAPVEQQLAAFQGLLKQMQPQDVAGMLAGIVSHIDDAQALVMMRESFAQMPADQLSGMLDERMVAMTKDEKIQIIYDSMANQSQETKDAMLGPVKEKIEEIGIITMTQTVVPIVQAEYEAIGVANLQYNFIWREGGIMLLITAISMVCNILASLFASKASMGLGRILRGKVFRKVENYSLHEFDAINTSSLITRTTNDITRVQMTTMMILRLMVMAPLMCVGALFMALSKDVKMTMILGVSLPILVVIILLVVRYTLPKFKSMQEKIDKLNLVLREFLTGIRVIRAFNREDKEKGRFDAASTDLMKVSVTVNRVMAFLMPVMMLLSSLTSVAVIWFGAHWVDAGILMVGDMMACMQYVMQVMFSLMMASMLFIMLPQAMVSAGRINQVLDMESEVKDPEKPALPSSQHGYVEFKNVTFSYPGAEEPVLRDISFVAKPGETVAIIGGTGSGKSTLVNLVPRLYDVDEGQVFINGVNVRDMTQEDLRQKIGFVPQKPVLFTGTVAENIRYGKPGSTMEEVVDAARISQAENFISKMEHGFESPISQGGTNVSGGQKQRLSIARAIVRKPEVYVFDDSFSALDFKTDAALRAALKAETADATVIIVAQRVSTVLSADRILVMDESRIVGAGTHKELMKSCGVYQEIVSSQLSEEELA